MKALAILSSIPERVWVFVLAGIFILAGVGTYFLYTDTRLIEQKIISKQKELAAVLQLRDTYESRMRVTEKSLQKIESTGMSLAKVEGIVSKTLVGGRLTMLKPATTKEEKGKQQMVVELRVTNAPLGEIVSFLKAAEAAGFHVKKLQLTLPQANPTSLDMHVIVAQG
jgi:hypothetical protein